MKAGPATPEILAALEQLLASPTLPAQAARQGGQLLQKARAPVRLAVLGPAGVGKSQVVNLLAGARAVPETAPGVAIELAWGEREQSSFHLADGSVETTDGILPAPPSGRAAVSAAFAAPLPALQKISLCEAALPAEDGQAGEALDRAIREADVILWCSQGFGAPERAFWDRVPEEKKDHGFYILTRADELAAQGILDDRIALLQGVVADEFHSLIPVAGLQAVDAISRRNGRDGRDGRDDAALSASGGKALLTTVLRHVEHGRRALIDAILLFLSRYGSDLPAAAGRGPRSARPGRTVRSGATAPSGSGTAELFRRALTLLRERAQAMQALASAGEAAIADILELCAAASGELAELLAPAEDAGPEARSLLRDAQESADVIMLMQLEHGAGPAVDAVCVLLQLRRDLESRVAA